MVIAYFGSLCCCCYALGKCYLKFSSKTNNNFSSPIGLADYFEIFVHKIFPKATMDKTDVDINSRSIIFKDYDRNEDVAQ